MSIIDGEEFGRLLATFERSAFRLELQPQYNEPSETAAVAAWLAGDRTPPTAVPELAAWYEQTRAHTAAGRTVQRVRVQEDPPTPYQQWENWIGVWNRASGEDIRLMTRAKAYDVGLLPAAGDRDWWLLDETVLIVMTFDSENRRIRNELVEDAGALNQACTWRDLAVHHSVPDTTEVTGT